ncbi:MAG TPA: AsmA-like C-terminal region-containing protein [Patescibacteria group bacterium]|nr:AsmA-like C-terminal region-containing protein [Patescibacteria group bacterium]
MTEPAPPPAAAEDNNRLPKPLRVLLKLVMWLGVIATVFWGAMSLLLHFYLRGPFEMYAAGFFQLPVRIYGGVRLGTDLAKPSIVVSDIVAGADPNDIAQARVVLGRFEAGLPWQKIPEGAESTLSYFVKLERLRVDGHDYGDYDIPFTTLPNGDAEIRGFEGRIGAARINGDLFKTGQTLRAELAGHDIDYGQIAQGGSGGQMTAKVDLVAQALEQAPMVLATTQGHAVFIGGKGAIAGNALKFWGGSVFNAMGAKETAINCMGADFVVEKGIAKSRATVIDTEDATIYGEGEIDFVRQVINMRFTPAAKKPSLLTINTPITVTGPFDNVAATPEASSLGALFSGGDSGVRPSPLAPAVNNGNACAVYVEARAK